jgi:hypothetical protein
MRLLIFAIVGAVLFLIAYALGVGGTVSSIIFLFVLFCGAADRVAQPLIHQLRGLPPEG